MFKSIYKPASSISILKIINNLKIFLSFEIFEFMVFIILSLYKNSMVFIIRRYYNKKLFIFL